MAILDEFTTFWVALIKTLTDAIIFWNTSGSAAPFPENSTIEAVASAISCAVSKRAPCKVESAVTEARFRAVDPNLDEDAATSFATLTS